MSTFVQKKINVDEASASMTFRPGQFARPAFSLEQKNIFLIGMRASGKTTLGAALATAFSCPCVDTDAVIVAETGQSIEQLVAHQGWEHFRTLEEQVLARVATLPGKIIATGGGIILSEANRACIQATGICFYLSADTGLLTQRQIHDANPAQRPALTTLVLHDEIATTLTEREPLYMATMDHILQANRSTADLVDDVLVALGCKEWDYQNKERIMDRY